VNIYTGKITVQKIIACYDAGTIINPSLFKGQVEGGIIMGIGYAITEEIRLSRGVITNNNFDRYLVPTSMDIPEIEVLTAPFADSEGPYGAKGIGEPAVIPTAAAIANAVSRALGVEVFNLPLSLEEVTKRLERVEEDL
jgi:CO/xanthine dehydrogenase Mo-binding subunit